MKSPLQKLFEKSYSNWWIMFFLIFIPSQLFIYAMVVVENFEVETNWVLQGEAIFFLLSLFVASLVYGIHIIKRHISNLPIFLKILIVFLYCISLSSVIDFGMAFVNNEISFLQSLIENTQARAIWTITSTICFLVMLFAGWYIAFRNNRMKQS